MFDIFLLIFIFSLDSFLVSIAYSIKKIKINCLCLIIISLVNVLSILFSVYIGIFISLFISKQVLKIISFLILVCLGLYNILDDFIQNKFINDSKILKIIIDKSNADLDKSNNISVYEAIILSFVLSIDSFLGSISIGFSNIPILILLIIVFITNLLFLLIGKYLGSKLNSILNINFSYISGIIIILIALLRLL